MNNTVDSTSSNLMQSSLWGTIRGLYVETLLYPLEAVKIRQQCSHTSEKSIYIARRIFQQEGVSAFYKGLSPQLVKTGIKQIWCWPMIMGIPNFLKKYGIGTIHQQILTGFSIATVDALITTPLERAKVLSALSRKRSLSLASIYKDGWRGFTTYWAKRSINWCTFLTAQKYLRDCDHIESERRSFSALAKIGIQVALIVSIVSAPFDIANTLKQADNQALFSRLSRQGVWKLYRGWPLNALSLIVHNVASIIVIEKLS